MYMYVCENDGEIERERERERGVYVGGGGKRERGRERKGWERKIEGERKRERVNSINNIHLITPYQSCSRTKKV